MPPMSEKKKSVLGRGLSALLESNDTTTDTLPATGKAQAQVLSIPLEKIEVNPFQPRTNFEEESLEELAESIRIHGVIQPVTVRRIENNRYQLIAGERRLRASKLAGKTEVPAYVRAATDQESIEIALIENIQREDLNPLEISINYKRLMDECALNQEQLAQRLGKNRSTVTNFLRLLKLPPDMQAALRDEKISMGHAKALMALDQLTSLMLAFKEVVAKNLSVRQTEQLVKNFQPGGKTKKAVTGKGYDDTLPTEVRKWQDELSSHLSTKVMIERSSTGSGDIIIRFYNDTDLQRLVETITE